MRKSQTSELSRRIGLIDRIVIPLARLLSPVLSLCAGCTSLPIPHDQTNFAGLHKLLLDPRSWNSSLPEHPGPLRIFLIHGMANHCPDWGQGYLQPIAKRLGPDWSLHIASNHAVQWSEDPSNTFTGSVRVYTLQKQGETRAVVYQLTWSALTKPFKDERFATDVTQWRPAINQMVRGIVDENLSDVVLYLSGFDNYVLNNTVQDALKAFYTGRWDPNDQLKGAIPDSPVVVFTESLGSAMFVDAVNALGEHDQVHAGRRSDLQNFLNNSQIVFMMANQLNLLEMPTSQPSGQVPPSQDTSIPAATAPATTQPRTTAAVANPRGKHFAKVRQFLWLRYRAMHPESPKLPYAEQLGQLRPLPNQKPLFFVAFNDPYDVLSFKVTNEDLGEYASLNLAAVDNFAPRNDVDWLWLLENPATAHNGYKDNIHVTNLVVDGYSVGKDLPAQAP